MTSDARADDASPEAAPEPAPARLRGVDAARGLALIGMMAVHILPLEGSAEVVHGIAGGRSAALFATLAGVGLALASGGSTPRRGADLARARRATLARAGVIFALGLTLGGLTTPAAVILQYYGVLFVVAVAVLGWPARRLAIAAVVAAVTTPIASHLLRVRFGRSPGQNLTWESLGDPAGTVVTILLTGYYPVLTWTTYLLAGLAVGRLPLRETAVAAKVAVTGAVLAAAAWLAARVVVGLAGGPAALARLVPDGSPVAWRGDELLIDSFYGTTPTSSWWFLGIAAPHSGAIPDLVHTTGTSLAVLGVALLVVPRAGRVATPLVFAGSMTLTLYSLHVAILGVTDNSLADPDAVAWQVWATNVIVALALAAMWRAQGARGPLEELAATAARLASEPRTDRPQGTPT